MERDREWVSICSRPPPSHRGVSDVGAQREASASFRESLVVYMTRDSLRTAPPVFLDINFVGSRETSPTKRLVQDRVSGLRKSLWVASYLVLPNRWIIVWLKKTLLHNHCFF